MKFNININIDWIIVGFLALIAGCTSSPKNEGVHPDPSRFPPDSVVDFTVTVSDKTIAAPLPHFFHSDGLDSVGTIGDGSVLADEYYETPKSVDIDEQGNIYLVQEHTNTIRVYNHYGEYKYSIGRGGRGPGEFTLIFAFAFDKDYQILYVLDGLDIEIFKRVNNRFEYSTTVPHKIMRPYDMCLMNNALFISGYTMNAKDMEAYEDGDIARDQIGLSGPIHKFDLNTFEHLTSFGFRYESYSGWASYTGRLSQTMLSCNEYTDTIVGYLKHYPYLLGYDETGTRKWVSKIEGYKSLRSEEIKTPEGPAFYPFMNENIYHYKYPAQKIYHDEYSLLQFIYTPLIDYVAEFPATGEKKPYFRTILVNTKTGELFHSDAYKYISAWKDETAVIMDIEPNFGETFQIYEIK